MQAGADIQHRILRAVALRRLRLWLGVLAPWLMLRSPAGVVVCALWIAADAVVQLRRAARSWPRWLDGAMPAMEDSSALLLAAQSPLAMLQRQRLLSRLSAGVSCRAIVAPHLRIGMPWLFASALAAGGVFAASERPGAPAQHMLTPSAAPAAGLTVHVEPPAYTGTATIDTTPRELVVPEHSVVRWCSSAGAPATIELADGQLLRAAASCAQWTATESTFWRWQGTRYTLRTVADQPPQVTVSKPGELVETLARDAKAAAIAFSIRDDYKIVQATLHMTLARGSGENIRFSDRETPVPAGADARQRAMNRHWTLAELGMEPGDELYFFVRAQDNAPKPHIVQSPTYTLRLPGPVAVDDESTAVPLLAKPENLRSQRQIIIDTEQLVADMKGALPAAQLRARSEAIAFDQSQLRRRYGHFLGEESSLFGDAHEHEGEKHDIVAEFGHAHDQAESATLFDEGTKTVLRRALAAMWDAEKALRAIEPKHALPPEYKALEAIKQLQQADRIYLHKTAFVPPAIKEEKRLSGDVVGARSYARPQSGNASVLEPQLRALFDALGSGAPLPALWARDARQWVAARLRGDDQRLAAQRAIQDVADGCLPCRASLRAWLRAGITEAPVLLRARACVDTPLTRAFDREAAQ